MAKLPAKAAPPPPAATSATQGELPTPESAAEGVPGSEAPAQLRAPVVAAGGGGAATAKVSELGAQLPLAGLDDDTEYVALCLYGREGSTKTTSALTAANHGPVLLINAEAGAKPSALKRRGIDTSNIRIWPNTKKGEDLTFEGLEQLFFATKAKLLAEPGSVYCIVWDSLTEIAYRLLTKQREYGREKALRNNKERERFFTDISDYGVMSSQISELIRKFRDLPCHFVICALERRDVDSDTGKVRYGPAVNPALSTEIPGFVDLMVHCEMAEMDDAPDGVEVRGYSRAHGAFRAKDRFGVLPRVIPDPTFTRIHAYVTSELDSESDELLAAVKARSLARRGQTETPPVGDEASSSEPSAA